MPPLTPHWEQPSHPFIQEVVILDEASYSSKSLSKIALPPFAVYAEIEFPPCTLASKPTYATVQCGRDRHLNLNSDMLFINHSCEPSLIFDLSTSPANPAILVGPNGLKVGEELTFFYPSTEWKMAQSFTCLCGTSTCRGRISGAQDMSAKNLEGIWLNGWIRELLTDRASKLSKLSNSTEVTTDSGVTKTNDTADSAVFDDKPEQEEEREKEMGKAEGEQERNGEDELEKALVSMLRQARVAVQLAEEGLSKYRKMQGNGIDADAGAHVQSLNRNGNRNDAVVAGKGRAGPTSRELCGEMGGDTVALSTT